MTRPGGNFKNARMTIINGYCLPIHIFKAENYPGCITVDKVGCVTEDKLGCITVDRLDCIILDKILSSDTQPGMHSPVAFCSFWYLPKYTFFQKVSFIIYFLFIFL